MKVYRVCLESGAELGPYQVVDFGACFGHDIRNTHPVFSVYDWYSAEEIQEMWVSDYEPFFGFISIRQAYLWFCTFDESELIEFAKDHGIEVSVFEIDEDYVIEDAMKTQCVFPLELAEHLYSFSMDELVYETHPDFELDRPVTLMV